MLLHNGSTCIFSAPKKAKHTCVQNYYMYVTEMLSRPGVACASTPTAARNAAPSADFIDASGSHFERTVLAPAAADDKYIANGCALAARGYSLWRVLRCAPPRGFFYYSFKTFFYLCFERSCPLFRFVLMLLQATSNALCAS